MLVAIVPCLLLELVVIVVQNNSNDGINSCKACNTANLHTLKPENSVILLSANLGLERRWIRRKTRDYLLQRALRRQIFH